MLWHTYKYVSEILLHKSDIYTLVLEYMLTICLCYVTTHISVATTKVLIESLPVMTHVEIVTTVPNRGWKCLCDCAERVVYCTS